MKTKRILLLAAIALCANLRAQVNSGSNGSDGAFNPTTNIVINMADHPTGIYHYTSVNISNGVTVTFIPNANNTPVVWLVQSNCVIAGTVNVSANPNWNGSYNSYPVMAQEPGPGGFPGGNGGTAATPGQGLGGGSRGSTTDGRTVGGNASFATVGGIAQWNSQPFQAASGVAYGNQFIVPLIGGSGGGGNAWSFGGGGGGAILIAVSGTLNLTGSILANGSMGSQASTAYVTYPTGGGGAGSGGSIRLVASRLSGTGNVTANAGSVYAYDGWCCYYSVSGAGSGRVRFDTVDSTFSGTISGAFSQGFQPIIIPTNGFGAQLTVSSVGGVPVSASPSGQLATPDAVLSAQQNNPIPIVVHCSNIPLNTQITVSVKPANGATVSATGLNTAGTLSSSTATVLINMPRGGGLIYATAAN